MSVIDIDSIQLAKGSHDSPDEGMCVMEAVAYVNGEDFSDHPACACPVIAAFLRSYNDSVTDEVRQTLKPLIRRLGGTKNTEEVEERRSLIAADWLVRTHAPAWLRLAGLNSDADALASLPEITSIAQVESIRGPIEAARDATEAAALDAARDAALDATGAAAMYAAWDAALDAAKEAAGAASQDAACDAALDAAWDAARAAAKEAAKEAAGAAALNAARAAAMAATWDAAKDAARAAAWAALQPTVVALQATVPALIERMIVCSDAR